MSDPTPTSPRYEPYPSENFANVVAAVRALEHPRQIGPYTIISVIGEGGMGTVYKAEQHEPIRRTVALKVIKPGMDTREVIARFESERQALAMMSHPNVARVLDAGATELGRPFFVMEIVDGEPITTFADRRQFSIGQRLDLFVQACEAIQHAHQKAIIHRDVKPSNILVTEDDSGPRVKVIDFGVAKAIDHRLTERSLFTELGRLVGTPEYMSPEQATAGSHNVDTRSDVYSLGVVLYELLSGVLPFDGRTLRSAAYGEIQRIIREVEPPRPSTRLSSLGSGGADVARVRQATLPALTHQLKQELEWIPLKAMRKRRNERYHSAAELAADVRNYLAHQPLVAAPESRWYRTHKFVRRHRRLVAGVTTAGVLVLAGLAGTAWQAGRALRAEGEAIIQRDAAEAARLRASKSADELREVNRFLTEDILGAAAPEVTRGRDLTVRQALDRAAVDITSRFATAPLTEASIRIALAQTLDALGVAAEGLPHAQTALELRRKASGNDDLSTLEAQYEVARLLINLDRFVEAEALLHDLLDRGKRLQPASDDVLLHASSVLGQSFRRQRRFQDAEPYYRQQVEHAETRFGRSSLEYAHAINALGVLMFTWGKLAEAEPLYRESLEIRRRLMGEDHPSILVSRSNLLGLRRTLGERAALPQEYHDLLVARRRVLKDDHPSTLLTLNDWAVALAETGQFEQAIAAHREALERRRRVLGERDEDTLQSLYNLGRTLTLAGQVDEALVIIQQAVELRRATLGEKHPHSLGAALSLAQLYQQKEDWPRAIDILRRVRENEAELGGDTTTGILIMLARCSLEAKLDDASEALDAAAGRLPAYRSFSSHLVREVDRIIELLDSTGDAARAATWRQIAVEGAPKTP